MSEASLHAWKTNALGTCGDLSYCMSSVCCPAFAYYSISELFEVPPAGLAESCAGGYCLCFGFLIRSRLRNQYNLKGSILFDFLSHLSCHCLALARIWREAKFQKQCQIQSTCPVQIQPPIPQTVEFNQKQKRLIQPQPYLPITEEAGLGFYEKPAAVNYRPFMNHNSKNTVDTSLSGFDADALLMVDFNSDLREGSIDPSPSNTDTNPWDTLPDRKHRGEGLIHYGCQSGPLERSFRRPISREKYLKYIKNSLEEQSSPVEYQDHRTVRKVESDEAENSGTADLNKRLENLRPPRSAASQTTREEDSEAADRIILERDFTQKSKHIEERFFNK
eukprot:g2897.t1